MLFYLAADDIRLVTCSLGPHSLSWRLGLRRKAVILPASLKAATQMPQNAANAFSCWVFFFPLGEFWKMVWLLVARDHLSEVGICIKKNYIGTHVKTGEAGEGGSNRFFFQLKKITQMSSENLCLATLSNTYDFLLFFNVLFPLFLFQNGRGAVIVCIIYTTGYKTPLCHSPESTYRCGCTVYQHMYCSKISFACMAPSRPLETGGKSLLRAHDKRVEQRPPGSRRLPWTSPSFQSQSFRRRLASVHISAPQQSAISLCWPPLTPQRVLWLMLLLWSDSNSCCCSCLVFLINIFIFNLAQIINTVTDPYGLAVVFSCKCIVLLSRRKRNTNTGNANDNPKSLVLRVCLRKVRLPPSVCQKQRGAEGGGLQRSELGGGVESQVG